MAGGHYQPFKVDPAIERWVELHNTMYTRFRPTPKNVGPILIFGVAVPYLTYAVAKYSNNRWDLRGKTRDESLLAKPPVAQVSDDQ